MGRLSTNSYYDRKLIIENESQDIKYTIIFLIGLGLCFTGIGALIGAPLIIAVFIARIKGQDKYKGGWRGDCPKCNTDIFWYMANEATKQGRFRCPHCNATVEFYDGMFIHEEPHT